MKKKEKKEKVKKIKEPKEKKIKPPKEKKVKPPKVKKERVKKQIDWSIVLAVLGIILISLFLAWATMIKLEQDGTINNGDLVDNSSNNIVDNNQDNIANDNKQEEVDDKNKEEKEEPKEEIKDDTNKEEDDNSKLQAKFLIETNTINYVKALEYSYVEKLANDINYVIPREEHITTVNKELSLTTYPDSVNLFVNNGTVSRGSFVYGSFIAEYQDGKVTVLE